MQQRSERSLRARSRSARSWRAQRSRRSACNTQQQTRAARAQEQSYCPRCTPGRSEVGDSRTYTVAATAETDAVRRLRVRPRGARLLIEPIAGARNRPLSYILPPTFPEPRARCHSKHQPDPLSATGGRCKQPARPKPARPLAAGVHTYPPGTASARHAHPAHTAATAPPLGERPCARSPGRAHTIAASPPPHRRRVHHQPDFADTHGPAHDEALDEAAHDGRGRSAHLLVNHLPPHRRRVHTHPDFADTRPSPWPSP
jgi:hypothetical protein